MTTSPMNVDEALLVADGLGLPGASISGEATKRALDRLAAEVRRQHAVIERCAWIAQNGCLVPPDGGSPTEDERLLCQEIERRIREVAA